MTQTCMLSPDNPPGMGGGTLFNGLHGDDPPPARENNASSLVRKGCLLQARGVKRVGISRVEESSH